ncbi:MAG: lytic transglycosylase domain-containing protein [Blastocatellia bacterium]|nr:lytic transglycosylase domain-containing protein [Blastocatellia bacterium]
MKDSVNIKMMVSPALLFLLAALLANSVVAQSASVDDPVKRAQERIEAAVDGRAAAAERALAASQLVNEGVEARKQGNRTEAQTALRQAEMMIASSAPAERGLLTEELLRRIAEEQEKLNPKPVASAKLSRAKNDPLISTPPRLVVARYHTYRDTFARILAEEKVPTELLAVAFVESRFNPLALSSKGARGIWQLMPATAARYGLRIDADNDQRTHPESATRAAARYLRDLYQQFGDWKLALAAYNTGEGRVQRIITRTGIRDFDEIARRGWLPLETRNYVPAVLAAWEILVKQPGTTK